MGAVDRVIRFTIAVVIGILYYKGVIAGTAGIVLLVVGIVFLLTSLVSVCPLYSLFRLNTRSSNPEQPEVRK